MYSKQRGTEIRYISYKMEVEGSVGLYILATTCGSCHVIGVFMVLSKTLNATHFPEPRHNVVYGEVKTSPFLSQRPEGSTRRDGFISGSLSLCFMMLPNSLNYFVLSETHQCSSYVISSLSRRLFNIHDLTQGRKKKNRSAYSECTTSTDFDLHYSHSTHTYISIHTCHL